MDAAIRGDTCASVDSMAYALFLSQRFSFEVRTTSFTLAKLITGESLWQHAFQSQCRCEPAFEVVQRLSVKNKRSAQTTQWKQLKTSDFFRFRMASLTAHFMSNVLQVIGSKLRITINGLINQADVALAYLASYKDMEAQPLKEVLSF
jgi:hypothetical protein